jgi:hypothetical protein
MVCAKNPQQWGVVYVVALNFYGDKAFFRKFMVVRVRLCPYRPEPVWAGGVTDKSMIFITQ